MIEILNELLVSKKLTFYQLHKMTGIGTNSFSDLKKVRIKSLSFKNMIKIADALDISLDEFRTNDLQTSQDNSSLKLFRKSHALSQEEIAEKLNLTPQLYKKIESGCLFPSHFFMMKLKQEFPEFDLNQLFDKEQGV